MTMTSRSLTVWPSTDSHRAWQQLGPAVRGDDDGDQRRFHWRSRPESGGAGGHDRIAEGGMPVPAPRTGLRNHPTAQVRWAVGTHSCGLTLEIIRLAETIVWQEVAGVTHDSPLGPGIHDSGRVAVLRRSRGCRGSANSPPGIQLACRGHQQVAGAEHRRSDPTRRHQRCWRVPQSLGHDGGTQL